MLDQPSKANMPSAPLPLLSNGKFRIVVPSAITEMNMQQTLRELGQNYNPSDYDIFCGRGKGFYNRPGNKKFRMLVNAHIPEYLAAKSKVDKSAVLNAIVDKVRSTSDPITGRPAQFIKFTKKTGWVEIGDDQAREKVGHAMREAISSSTSSSSGTQLETKSKPLKTSRPSPPTPLRALSFSVPPFQPLLTKESDEDLIMDSVLYNEVFGRPPSEASIWGTRRSSFVRNSLTSDMMQAAIESFIGV